MTQNFKAPKLRFPGFTEDWEQRKLSTLAEFNPKSALPEYFEYVDLESVVGTEMVSHRTEEKVSAPSRAQRLAKEGDVFYQTVRPYQRNNYLFNKADDNYVFSTGYAQMRPYGDGYFLLSLVQTDNFVNVVLDNCTGTSYPAINSTELSNIEVSYPKEIEEQKKIGTYFKNLDNLITLHQRKFETLKKLRKGFLQKMFPKNGESVPEIRFPGFTDAWEQRKVSEITTSYSGGTPKSGTAEYYDGNIPFIRSGEIYSNKTELFITELGLNNSSAKMVHVGDILYALYGATSGEVSRAKLDGAINQAILAVLPNEEINADFLVEWFRKEKENIIATYLQGGQGNLSAQIIKDLMVDIPSSGEQKKIGDYFTNLNNLITLHQRKLDILKKLKQGMLQQMFI